MPEIRAAHTQPSAEGVLGAFHGFQNSCCILVGSLLTARSIRLRALWSRGGLRHTYLAGVRGGKMSIILITAWVVFGPGGVFADS